VFALAWRWIRRRRRSAAEKSMTVRLAGELQEAAEGAAARGEARGSASHGGSQQGFSHYRFRKD